MLCEFQISRGLDSSIHSSPMDKENYDPCNGIFASGGSMGKRKRAFNERIPLRDITTGTRTLTFAPPPFEIASDAPFHEGPSHQEAAQEDVKPSDSKTAKSVAGLSQRPSSSASSSNSRPNMKVARSREGGKKVTQGGGSSERSGSSSARRDPFSSLSMLKPLR